jgi:tetratricopeptide (TPR) repeat protein
MKLFHTAYRSEILRSVILAAACAVGLSATVPAGEVTWVGLMAAGNQSMDQNRFTAAAESFRSAAVLARSSGDTFRTAISMDHLGVAYDALGRDQQAETAIRQAIRALESFPGDGDSYLTRSCLDLARIYLKRGRPADARIFAERAVTALTGQKSADLKDTASALTVLASVDTGQHKMKHAETRDRQAMAMLDQAGLSQSEEWISAANGLGILLIRTGRPAEGEQYLRDALSRNEATLRTGSDQLILALLLGNLGTVDYKLRRFDESEKYLRRALETYERELGPTHPDTARILLQCARLYRATNRKAEARVCERRAKECLTVVAGPALPATIDASDLRARRR